MKIQDLITFDKVDLEELKRLQVRCPWRKLNNTKEKYKLKHGYYWKVPSHSSVEGILLNNYEKDCVVAYVDNRYFTVFLIQISENRFRGFCYLKKNLRSLIISSYAYPLSPNSNKQILDLFKEEEADLKIVEENKYTRFARCVILDAI